MFNRPFRAILLRWVGSIAMTAAIAVSARAQPQTTLPIAGSAGAETLSADLLETGLYLISSAGGNSLLRLSASGSILIDGQRPNTYRAQMSQVHKISKLSDLPVRALILTDHHENHAGNAGEFEAAGIRLIAQENTRRRLSAGAPTIGGAAGGPIQAPRVSYDRNYVLQMGGVEVHLFHFGNACTNGDTVVYFHDLKVVAIGDLFTTGLPEPDYPAGGSLVAWGSVIAQVLKLDFDRVVPGQGRIVTRAELEAFKGKIDTLVSRAHGLVRDGVPKDQLMTQLETADLGWRGNFTGDELDGFYAELVQMQ